MDLEELSITNVSEEEFNHLCSDKDKIIALVRKCFDKNWTMKSRGIGIDFEYFKRDKGIQVYTKMEKYYPESELENREELVDYKREVLYYLTRFRLFDELKRIRQQRI